MAEPEKKVTVSVGPEKHVGVEVDAGEALDIPSGAAHLQRKMGGKEVQ